MKILLWLQNWYKEMCDGSWEHTYGITIDTLDNPGWKVLIDIIDTPLENKEFNAISDYKNDQDWLFCQIKDGKFNGGGDSDKLEKILNIFKDWVES